MNRTIERPATAPAPSPLLSSSLLELGLLGLGLHVIFVLDVPFMGGIRSNGLIVTSPSVMVTFPLFTLSIN